MGKRTEIIGYTLSGFFATFMAFDGVIHAPVVTDFCVVRKVPA